MRTFFFWAICCTCLMPGFSVNSVAQEVKIKVRKGEVRVNSMKVDSSMHILIIHPDDKVVIGKNALVVAMTEGKMIPLEPGNKYSGKQISSLLKNSSSTFTSDFLSIIFSEPIQKPKQQIAGGLLRGNQGVWSFFYPEDEMIVLSDQILLDVGCDTCLVDGKWLVLNESSGKIVYNEIPVKNQLLLEISNPGYYSWSYTISCTLNNQEIRESYKNFFVVPDKKIKQTIMAEITSFLTLIKDFDPELQKEFVMKYMEMQRYYLFR